ncbi:5-formyltetrahydrofolate cyclo-ligase [Dyadobacter pollutisoli]|uniref:5-formyltetrahydrofolate cyclo-ligase n=1 Tax=Dyadobacter pollutisoli TaxID=2910158 RepID=A0A9E8SJJ7_9BACT|nr:5-formyltetrahydrofolate cyclo-ligase [Dyadobacter pollutisoli]WAC10923.1 5-formyltetrahydrofolate cyclo-ligase [Dyadobacter pollutisoli]
MDKALLRKDFLMKRIRLTQEEASIKTDLIIKNLLQSLELLAFETVHIFLPQLGKNEIDTWKIIPQLRISFPDVSIAVPYVIPGTREMEHCLLDSQTILIPNQWKIPEPDPQSSKIIYPENIDVVLVPLLAFDLKGYRVGYGGGYYDRFLAQCRPDTIRIGLSYFGPVDEIGDIDPYDVPLHYCITPGQTYQF